MKNIKRLMMLLAVVIICGFMVSASIEQKACAAEEPVATEEMADAQTAEEDSGNGLSTHLIAFGGSLLLAIIVVSIMKSSSYNKVTTNKMTYYDQGSRGITLADDKYMRTDVVKTEKPKTENK